MCWRGTAFQHDATADPETLFLALCVSLIRLHPVSTMQNAVGVRWWCEEVGGGADSCSKPKRNPFSLFPFSLDASSARGWRPWENGGKRILQDERIEKAFFWMRGGMFLKTGKKPMRLPSHQLMGWMRGNFHIWTLFFLPFSCTYVGFKPAFPSRFSPGRSASVWIIDRSIFRQAV